MALGPKKERLLASRTVSSVLVILVHIFFFFFFAISILKFDQAGHRVTETILFLPTRGNDENARRHLVAPEIKEDKAPAVSAAPIAIPRPPPPPTEEKGQTAAPGDILGAVGQTLACAAGNFEHLTQPERERCRRVPWQGAKTPNGSIVMVPKDVLPRLTEPAPEFRMSGAEQLNRDLATGGPPCPILQNTPCLHGILNGGGPAGALGTHN
ncbi:MAG TPA: hypothetical protein VFS01_00770 [Rhizomicrobium sp.]|jgi:hypothetical protein|nr:hypothetical protein [Rhizomicrobium sp.]